MSEIVHDGVNTPTADPKDIDADVWYGFTYQLRDGEVITGSTWLIDGVPVVDEDVVNTVKFISSVYSGADTKARIQGGTRGSRYRLTNRLSTNVTPIDDKSLFFSAVQL